jgi:hypothetical protein
MKNALFIIVICISVLHFSAQASPPVRLAVVSEADETSMEADVLTADLSANKNFQLLEQNEIEKIYRAQGLSANKTDHVKLQQRKAEAQP